ncbi:MAG: type II secretion system F family protein [Candidatus Omnitrophota bacterium]
MPIYKYTVKDREGKTINGQADAKSRDNLIELLRKQEYTIISVTEGEQREARKKTSDKKVKIEDLVIFSRQLATMVEAGIPLVNVLDILSEQIEKQNFSEVITKVRDDVETGSSFSQALARHPKVFSQLYINMVKAGESSGMLDQILNRVAGYLEKTAALQRKVKTALVYPICVISIAISITMFLLIKVVPTFKGIFDMFGKKLPLPTQILLGISDFTRQYFLWGILGAIGLIIALAQYAKTERGRLVIDTILLKLPIFGILLKKASIAKFSRTLSTLIKSGVPILASLEIVGKTAGNKVIEAVVDGARNSVREGMSLAEPLAKSPVFPPMVTRMISAGEQAGELEKMLSKIADFYDEQVDATVTALTSIIEPVIILFLGVIIGFIVLAIFMPIFEMSSVIS